MQDAPLHASAVSFSGRGVLLLGQSGAGKSSLALQLIAMGADLVADDGCWLERRGDDLFASSPGAIAGQIEARGVGILRAPDVREAALRLVVDLDQTETERLPPHRLWHHAGLVLPCLHNSASAAFPAAIKLHITRGRVA